MLLCFAAGVALGTAPALTAEHSSPYHGIVERNLFGLNPPPLQPDVEAANRPQPSKITLTGITTLLGRKLALMKTPPWAKPGEQAKPEEFFILAVGERQAEIEVLEIDEVAGTVKVNNAGTVETVSFEKNGVMPGSGGMSGVPSPTAHDQGHPGSGVPGRGHAAGLAALPAIAVQPGLRR